MAAARSGRWYAQSVFMTSIPQRAHHVLARPLPRFQIVHILWLRPSFDASCSRFFVFFIRPPRAVARVWQHTFSRMCLHPQAALLNAAQLLRWAVSV